MNLEARTESLEHTVFGNGHPGLKLDVAILKKDVSELGDIKTRLSRVERSIWIAVGALGFIQLAAKFIN